MLRLHAFLLVSSTLLPGVASPIRPALTVRLEVENGVRVHPTVLTAVATRVQDIWRPYADVTVLAPDGPREATGEGLTLVVTDRLLDTRRESLGWIAFVDGRPQATGHVSIAAVRAVLRASTWNGVPGTQWPQATWRLLLVPALSRAVAHEVGHYLLGSPAHTRGLMRESFTADDLARQHHVHDRLDPADVERLRHRPLVAGVTPPATWTPSDPRL